MIQSHQVKDPEKTILTKIGNNLSIALKRGERLDSTANPSEIFVGGFNDNDYRGALVASANNGQIVSDVIMKTIYDRINEELIEILEVEEDVIKRHQVFKDVIRQAVKSAKEILVRKKSARHDRVNDNRDLGEFGFLVLVKDNDDYLHWSGLGDIHLLGLGKEVNHIKEVDEEQVTHRTTPGDIKFGYVLNSWDYVITATKSTVNRVDLEKYRVVFNSTLDFNDKVKLVMNSAVETDKTEHIGYAVLDITE